MNNLATVYSEQAQSAAESIFPSCQICGSTRVKSFLKGVDRFHNRRELYELVRCSSCSLVWLHNAPGPNEISAHYGRDYHRTISAAADSSPLRWKSHRDILLRHKQGGAILDLGCSSGVFLGTLKGGAWKLNGIEIDADQAEQARRDSGATVFTGDVMDAPFAPESFDAITAFDVVEHVYRPDEVVKKALTWLKPGGVFYLSLPNIDSWEAKMLGSYWYGLELPRHLSHFGPASLRKLFLTAGYREVYLATPPATYVERSVRYLFDEALRTCGISRVSSATAGTPPVAWRALRKVNRVTVLEAFRRIAAACGRGPNLEGVFQK
jgi:SAM-dependent methyltransferase